MMFRNDVRRFPFVLIHHVEIKYPVNIGSQIDKVSENMEPGLMFSVWCYLHDTFPLPKPLIWFHSDRLTKILYHHYFINATMYVT